MEGPSPLRAVYRAWRTGKLMKDYLLSYVLKTAPEPRGHVMAKITDESLTKKMGFPCFVTYNEWERVYDVHFTASGEEQERIRFDAMAVRGMTETEAVDHVATLIRSFLDKPHVAQLHDGAEFVPFENVGENVVQPKNPVPMMSRDKAIELGIVAGKLGEYRFDTGEPAQVPKVILGVALENSTPNADGTHAVRIKPRGEAFTNYIAEGKIEAGQMVQLDLTTGKVSSANKGPKHVAEVIEIDQKTGKVSQVMPSPREADRLRTVTHVHLWRLSHEGSTFTDEVRVAILSLFGHDYERISSLGQTRLSAEADEAVAQRGAGLLKSAQQLVETIRLEAERDRLKRQATMQEEVCDVQRAAQALIATGVTSDQMRGMTEKQLLTVGKESADYLAKKAAEPKIVAELLTFNEASVRLVNDNWPAMAKDIISKLKQEGVGGVLVFYFEPDNVASMEAAQAAVKSCGERYAVALPRPKKVFTGGRRLTDEEQAKLNDAVPDHGYPLAHQMAFPPMPAGSVLIFFWKEGNAAMQHAALTAAVQAQERGVKAMACCDAITPKMYPEPGYVFHYPEQDPKTKEEVLRAAKELGERYAIAEPLAKGPPAANILNDLVAGHEQMWLDLLEQCGLDDAGITRWPLSDGRIRMIVEFRQK